MNIPNFENAQVVDKNGFLTDAWKNILQQLIQQLQGNVSDEGYRIPKLTSAQITTLSTAASIGMVVYNSDTNKFMACIPSGLVGIFKEINLV